jgi:LacI family transcriptional regulator
MSSAIITALSALNAAPELNDNVRMVQAQLPFTCPPILFLKSRPHAKYTTVSIDNYQGAFTAAEYLVSLGRRRVACIAGPMEWLESRQRWQACADVMDCVGSPHGAANWTSGNWSSASGEAAFEHLMCTYPAMDAVFASNDQMALGVLHYAYTHGIRVPDDLAVIGFDDLSESAQFSPALTTVRQPLRELGSLAVKTLIAQIDGEELPTAGNVITIQSELVVRDSTPRPAAS